MSSELRPIPGFERYLASRDGMSDDLAAEAWARFFGVPVSALEPTATAAYEYRPKTALPDFEWPGGHERPEPPVTTDPARLRFAEVMSGMPEGSCLGIVGGTVPVFAVDSLANAEIDKAREGET
jgi:hypothetical protein